jgi:hypothetical protein
MFGNKVTSTRMQASSEEAAHDEVYEGTCAVRRDEDIIEHDLRNDVEQVPSCQTLRAHERRSEGVEENLEGAIEKNQIRANRLEYLDRRTQKRPFQVRYLAP